MPESEGLWRQAVALDTNLGVYTAIVLMCDIQGSAMLNLLTGEHVGRHTFFLNELVVAEDGSSLIRK